VGKAISIAALPGTFGNAFGVKKGVRISAYGLKMADMTHFLGVLRPRANVAELMIIRTGACASFCSSTATTGFASC
jgi:hypothetical protein